jgi:predicted phosphate transport protein (TIGR00153 family)
MPRQEAFVQLFCDHWKKIYEAAETLQMLLDGPGLLAARVGAIRRLEGEADEVARKIFVSANRTFNAPIDREDVLGLTHELDDVIDLIEDAAKAIERYDVRDFSAEMRAVVEAIRRSVALIRDALPLLESLTRDGARVLALCEQVRQAEGEADAQFDAGITRLRAALRDGTIDVAAYIDRKEIYEQLEAVVDKCDDVGNALETITVKHA